jgi:hypothetical protein
MSLFTAEDTEVTEEEQEEKKFPLRSARCKTFLI